jgi:hypothetical protein
MELRRSGIVPKIRLVLLLFSYVFILNDWRDAYRAAVRLRLRFAGAIEAHVELVCRKYGAAFDKPHRRPGQADKFYDRH